MPWFRVEDGFSSSRQVLSIPKRHRAAAAGFWTLAGTWSSRELTDGFIPHYMVSELSGTSRLAALLVECGLWEERGDGFGFRHWSKYQPTADEVRSDRQRERDRKRAQRRTKRGTFAGPEDSAPNSSDSEVSQGDNTRSPGGSPERSPGGSLTVPTRPDPTLKINIGAGEKVETENPDDGAFTRFWSTYPKKAGRGAARTAFGRALSKATAEEIIDGAAKYRDDPSRSDQYTKHATTWLNQECWADEIAPAPKARPKIGHWEEI